MARSKTISRQPVPATLKRFIRKKLAEADASVSLVKQIPDWYKMCEAAKVELGGRSLDTFKNLVYRLGRKPRRKKRGAKRRSRKIAIKAPTALGKTATVLSLREVIATYHQYILLVPSLRAADAFLKKEGLKAVIVGGAVKFEEV